MTGIRRTLVTVSAASAIVLALAGCVAGAPATAATAAPEGQVVVVVDGGQPQSGGVNAGTLALGTFYLEGTDLAVTAEQAADLLPLWLEVQSQTAGRSSGQPDLAAELEQIRAAMTAEQLKAIQTMDQGSEAVSELVSSLGIAMPTGMPANGQQPQGTPPAGGQQPQGTPPADGQQPQGTPPAGGGQQPGGAGPGGMGMLDGGLLDKLIELLQARAGN